MAESRQPTLTDVINLAEEAGKIVQARFEDDHILGYKSPVDLVTEADKASETYIIEYIHQRFPGHAIITEESGELDGDAENCWIVDPLDGTVNYAHHLPIYSISIAFRHNGRLQLGVVYDPSLNECFRAELGMGAYLNDKKISASTTKNLIGCLLVTGFPYNRESAEYARALRLFSHMTTVTQGVRRLGSAALDMCYVACGRLDAYWELSIHLWDIAAAALIMQEAGGIVRNLDGDPDILFPPYALVASAPGVYDQIIAEIKSIP
jgi:myo-inositol-1(or 4)-monophosphatase